MASVSEPANAASVTCTPSVAPKAMASRSTSSADGGPERDHRARAAGFARQLDTLGHGPAVVGAHLERQAVAFEAAVGPELHVLELWDLLDEGGHTHERQSSQTAATKHDTRVRSLRRYGAVATHRRPAP